MQVLENSLDNLSMFSQVPGEDQDVVEVDGDFPLSDQVSEDVVYYPLERCR